MSRHRPSAGGARGFSLIELLVSITIGLIVTLAVTSVMIHGEKTKRTSTSINDIDQTGAYAAYLLDRLIRSAGSGFAQNWDSAYGCLLNVSKNGTQILPMPAAGFNSGSAFANVGKATNPYQFRLAPIVIAKGYAGTSGDVLVVMAGTAGVGEAGTAVSPGPIGAGATSLLVRNALGFGTDDIVLLADAAVGSGCLMEQIGTRTRTDSGTTLPLAGAGANSYYAGSGSTVGLTAFGASTSAIQLGNANVTTPNMPQFQAIGVGANNTLVSYDLLQVPSSTSVLDTPLADGVTELRAIYGISTTNPPGNVVDAWADATSTDPAGDYSAATLTDGSATSQTKLRRIVAVRLGMILRSSLAEGRDYTPASTQITLFAESNPTLKQTHTLTTDEQQYRFRTVELMIPLRNALLAP